MALYVYNKVNLHKICRAEVSVYFQQSKKQWESEAKQVCCNKRTKERLSHRSLQTLKLLWSDFEARESNIWAAINFLLISINFIRRDEIHIFLRPNICTATLQRDTVTFSLSAQSYLNDFLLTLRASDIFVFTFRLSANSGES